MTLRHDYGPSKHMARVTTEHVRESLTITSTTPGAWLNIVGYVQAHQGSETTVQATMLWEAGPLKPADYERALQARKDASKAITAK